MGSTIILDEIKRKIGVQKLISTNLIPEIGTIIKELFRCR